LLIVWALAADSTMTTFIQPILANPPRSGHFAKWLRVPTMATGPEHGQAGRACQIAGKKLRLAWFLFRGAWNSFRIAGEMIGPGGPGAD
jgi:hypothetical protein